MKRWLLAMALACGVLFAFTGSASASEGGKGHGGAKHGHKGHGKGGHKGHHHGHGAKK